jgi:hypothetical protein
MYRRIIILTILLFLSFRLIGQEENYISLYLLNFTRYVEWPAEKRTGTFIIEVLGHASVYEKLKEVVSGKKVGNQPIEVRNYMTAKEMGKPHMMFVGHWRSREMSQVLDKLEGESTLIIAEKEGMIDQGAAINFIIKDGKINFEFKETHARQRGLSVSSRLARMGIVLD